MLPKAIGLQTSDGDHAGFILLAVEDDATSGDCIFMVMPEDPELLDSPALKPLLKRKSLGESQVEVTSITPLRLVIQTGRLPNLVIEFTKSGTGKWREEPPGKASGIAVLPSGE